MVMRKFKRSLDNTAEDSSDPNQLGVNSPGLARRNRGGSLSGELGGDTNSPGTPGTRRRFVYIIIRICAISRVFFFNFCEIALRNQQRKYSQQRMKSNFQHCSSSNFRFTNFLSFTFLSAVCLLLSEFVQFHEFFF